MTAQKDNPFINQDWLKAEKEIDEEFKGSVFEEIGMDKQLCPTCGAHLKVIDGDLICLNACHLVKQSQSKFHAFYLAALHQNIEELVAKFRTKGGDVE